MTNRCMRMVFALGLGIATTTPVSAQTSRVEVSGGYQVARVPDQTLPLGWNVDASINLDDRWGIVGELGGTYKTVSDGNLGVDVKLSVHTLASGARWSPARLGRLMPFLQLLAGAARSSASAEILSRHLGDSSTHFMLQPGGGVSMKMNESIGVVGQFDYRRIFLDDAEDGQSGENHFRVVVGMRFSF